MDAPLLQIKQVSKHFGGFTALSDVSLEIAQGLADGDEADAEAFGDCGFLGQFAVRNMNVGGIDVDMIEQVAVHVVVVTLKRIPINRIIFIQVERNYILKAQAFFFVHPHQLGI